MAAVASVAVGGAVMAAASAVSVDEASVDAESVESVASAVSVEEASVESALESADVSVLVSVLSVVSAEPSSTVPSLPTHPQVSTSAVIPAGHVPAK